MFNKIVEFFKPKKDIVILDKSVLLQPMQYLSKKLVHLDKLGGSVWVRELTAKESMLYNQRVENINDVDYLKSLNAIGYMVSLGTCDENGKALYTEKEVETLIDNSLQTVLKLHQTIVKLNNSGNIIKTINKKK